MILSDLALSALQQAEVEKACMYAQQVVTVASGSSSSFLRHTVLKLQHHLVPFADVAAVKTLETCVAAFR